MMTDLEYVIDWLENGREPGIRRAIDRRDSYKRMLLKDPRIIDTFSEQSAFEPAQEVSAYDKARIESALSALTAREKKSSFYIRSNSFPMSGLPPCSASKSLLFKPM